MLAVGRIQDILTSNDSWAFVILFFLQFFGIYPNFLVNTGKKFIAHMEQQDNYRDEQDMKTVQGRVMIKGRELAKQKLLQNARPIVFKAISDFMEDPDDPKAEFDKKVAEEKA
jgi:hypothetical protein